MSVTIRIGEAQATIRGSKWTADNAAAERLVPLLQRYTDQGPHPPGYVPDLDLAHARQIVELWHGELLSHVSERTEADDEGRIY